MAAQLGEATFHANNCKQEVTLEDGKVVEKMCRDSLPKPKRVNINPSPLPTPPPTKPPKPKAVAKNIRPWKPEEAPNKRMRVTIQNRKRCSENEAINAAALAWRAPTPSSTTIGRSWQEPVVERIAKRLRHAATVSDAT